MIYYLVPSITSVLGTSIRLGPEKLVLRLYAPIQRGRPESRYGQEAGISATVQRADPLRPATQRTVHARLTTADLGTYAGENIRELELGLTPVA